MSMPDKKPISKSVEKKLKKLHERLAKKDVEERMAAYSMSPAYPPSDRQPSESHFSVKFPVPRS